MYQTAKFLISAFIPFPPQLPIFPFFSSNFFSLSSLLLSIFCLSPPLPLSRHPSLFPLLILKEDEVRGTVLREEVEKLHEERNMLLETIEDLKQTVEQTMSGPEMDTKVSS